MSSELSKIKELYEIFVQFPFVCTDTRKILPNSLFFCLKGDNFDGNMFVKEAIEKGAKYVITDMGYEMCDMRYGICDMRYEICDMRYGMCDMRYEICDMRYETRENKSQISNLKSQISNTIIVVNDVLATLQQLANYHRNQLQIPVIGITGTNGKTTTKELTASILSKKYKTAYTQGNLNNHIGVPLTLLSIKNEDEIAVIEMGANHMGEIEELCRIAQPNYGLITNIGKAHLEGFGTIENIIETKTALYRAAQVLFVNVEDEVLMQKAEGRKQKAEGRKQKAEGRRQKAVFYGKNTAVAASILEINPYLVIEMFGNKIQTHFTGNYNLSNILGATAIGRYFNVSNEDICDAISEYVPQNNRSQIIKNNTNTIIADYYNANPASMKSALNNFFQIEAKQKLAILGDMLELGENSLPEHKSIIDFCESENLETIFIGTNYCTLKNENAKFFMNVQNCNDYLKNNKIQNTFILLKGSRGIHLEDILL